MVIKLDKNYNAMTSTALLGYVGETNARPVSVEGMEIDGADRYVLSIDYGDGTVYEVDITGGTWTPTADILRSAQTISCQIAAKKMSGDEYVLVKKSRIFRLRIGAAIGDTAIPSPGVAVDALDRIDAIGRQAHADMQTAVTAAETATTAAENAKKSATAAGLSADTAEQAAERAETAQASAETSATQADTAMQGAENARAEAVTAQNAAKISAAQASASAQQTEADKTITAGYAKTAKNCADSTVADRQAVQTLAEQVTADKATVADHAAQVAEDRTAIDEAKTDIDAKYIEISNTATKLDTEYNNLTSNYYTKELANSTFATKTEINNTNTEVSELKEDFVDFETNQPNLFMHRGANLLDESLLVDGKRLLSDGNTGDLASCCATESFIDISDIKNSHMGAYFTSNNGTPIRCCYRLSFYSVADVSGHLKTYSCNSDVDLSVAICKIPDGANFVRVSYAAHTTSAYHFMLISGNSNMELINYEKWHEIKATVVPADLNEQLANLGDKTDTLFSTKGFADAILTLGGYIDTSGVYHNSETNWRSYCFGAKNIYAISIIKALTDASNIANVYFFSVLPQDSQDLNPTTFISYLPLTEGTRKINEYRNVTIPTNAKSIVIVNHIISYPDASADIVCKRYDDLIDSTNTVVSEISESIKSTGNVVNAFFDIWNANDFCIVDDEFWLYKANQGTSENPYDELRRYKLINGSFVKQATIYCDFGHWNTVDYCQETDCLIFGNGANSFDTEGNWFAVVPNAKSLSGTVSLANVGIKYNVDIGYKVQAVRGDDNLGQYNVAIVFANNATTIKQYLLHRGENGNFDGTFTEIDSGTLTNQIGVGGADYWNGKLTIGGARFNIAEVDVLGGYTHTEQERHYYTENGEPYSGSMQGVVIDSKYRWLFFNYSHSGVSHNCLLQMAR